MLKLVSNDRDRAGGSNQDELDERRLIEAVRAGDRDAETELFQRHRGQVAANLHRVLGPGAELEDLVQEVFVIVFRGIERFRGDARLSTWIYRIAVNVALGSLRRKKRRPPHVLIEDPGGDRAADPSDGPYRQLVRDRDRELCYRIMDELSPKKRIVLYLHEIEGRELKDIAEIVGAHPVTVRTRLYYARREFYQKVSERLRAEEATVAKASVENDGGKTEGGA